MGLEGAGRKLNVTTSGWRSAFAHPITYSVICLFEPDHSRVINL